MTTADMPSFFTARLSVERPNGSDFCRAWEIFCDAVAGEAVPGPMETLDAALAAYDSWRAGEAEGLGLWLIRTALGRETIGCVSVARRSVAPIAGSQHPGLVEFQIALRPNARGHGYAQEAARAVLRHAFGLGTSFVVAVLDSEDVGADQLLNRLGFQESGRSDVHKRTERVLTRRDFARALALPASLAASSRAEDCRLSFDGSVA